MKCRPCKVQMVATEQHGAETRLACPSCGRSVLLRDAGVGAPIMAEPKRSPRIFSLDELLEADDTAAVLTPEEKAAQSAAMREGKAASGKAKGERACEWCGTAFVPYSSNTRFCQTKVPLCREQAYAAKISKTGRVNSVAPEFQAALQ